MAALTHDNCRCLSVWKPYSFALATAVALERGECASDSGPCGPFAHWPMARENGAISKISSVPRDKIQTRSFDASSSNTIDGCEGLNVYFLALLPWIGLVFRLLHACWSRLSPVERNTPFAKVYCRSGALLID